MILKYKEFIESHVQIWKMDVFRLYIVGVGTKVMIIGDIGVE